MSVHQETLEFRTPGRGLREITAEVAGVVRRSGLECGVVAVWVDEDAKDDWALRGHHHGQTAWCDVCKADVSRAAAAEAGGHHHLYTAFCPDDACGIDVTRR